MMTVTAAAARPSQKGHATHDVRTSVMLIVGVLNPELVAKLEL